MNIHPSNKIIFVTHRCSACHCNSLLENQGELEIIARGTGSWQYEGTIDICKQLKLHLLTRAFQICCPMFVILFFTGSDNHLLIQNRYDSLGVVARVVENTFPL